MSQVDFGFLEDAGGLAGYELNISCPNVKMGVCISEAIPPLVGRVHGLPPEAAKQAPLASNSPLLLQDIGLIARAAEEAGAACLTVANTYPGNGHRLPHRGSHVLGEQKPWLIRPLPLKPITLRLVWETREGRQ